MDFITSSVETVSPEKARQWLATNLQNRPLSRPTVNRYRNDMAAGRWAFTGEPVQFDADNLLINGQHRLTALSELPDETSIGFLVLRGVPREAQMLMDQGRKRQTGQQLQMSGIKDANTVASGVRTYLSLDLGYMFRDKKLASEQITTAVIEEWVSRNSEIVEGLEGILPDIRIKFAPPSVAYAAAIVFWQKNPQACAEFFKGLRRGAGDSTHPITVLDKRLQRVRIDGVKMTSRDMLGMFIQAWNAWRKGQRLTKFQRPRGGSYTEATFPKAAS